MAITKIFPVRQRLDHLLSYIADAEKTAGGILVSGINCAPETAHESMSASFLLNDKPLRVLGYHIIQSFTAGEVEADRAHEIGIELAKRLFGESFQCVVATHLNTNVTHNHIAVCSTSFIDGHRYHSCKESYRQIREASDLLCREYGLSVIENPKPGRYKTAAEVKAKRSGNRTWLTAIKTDVDEAVNKAASNKQFVTNLQGLGYEVKIGKDISVRPPGKERFVRLARNIGDNYSKDGITQRILSQRYPKAQIARQSHSIARPKKLPDSFKGSLTDTYNHYLYLLGYWQKQNSSTTARMHYLLRDDIRKLDAYIEDTRLLGREGIKNTGQLDAFYHCTSRTIEELVSERKSLYIAGRDTDNPNAATSARGRIATINQQLRQLRKELRQCSRIAERSGQVLANIERIERDTDNQTLGKQRQRSRSRER